ncbi:Ppx/GppA phosphatase family protein [Coraliomargarita akajimensis]|nr:hypothetical protein [Coraliomargarita akajimensis]
MQSSPQPVAVIDVGSNSIKLLVARAGLVAGSVETVFAETIETRISAGISRDLPSLQPDAMDAGLQTIQDLLHLAHDYHPFETRLVATSAVRDALNGREFAERVEEATGHELRILSGTEEATLIGRGLACDPQIATLDAFTQMDLGGGSLELIHFHKGTIDQALSLPLGAVRLTERFIHDREAYVSAETAKVVAQHVREQIQRSDFDTSKTSTALIATGGAIAISRAILAAQQDLEIDQRSPALSLAEFEALRDQLCALPLHERLATPHLPAARADILPTALITIATTLQSLGQSSLTHSFYNLRYGIASELLSQS